MSEAEALAGAPGTLLAGLLPVLVLGPLLVGLVAALLPARYARWLTLAGAIAWLALAVVVAEGVRASGAFGVVLGRWAPPVGIELRADGLGAAMLLLTTVVGLAVAIGATADLAATGSEVSRRWYWPLWSLLVASLHAVYLSGDLFNSYVALELLTVVGVAMIALGGREALGPALRYLLVAVLGSLGFLVAVALVYAESGTLAFADAAPDGATTTTVLVALGLGTVGLGIKTAVWPMHGWLPPAHAAAPAAVSPLMSALVVKGSLVVLLRMWTEVADLRAPQALAVLVAVLGAAAIVHASVAALRQSSLKRVVACSTVAQVGYFLLALPLLTAGGGAGYLAWQGLLLLVVAHGLAKAAMFLAAGSLASRYGSTEISSMRGAVAVAPMEVLTFGVAGIVLAGLPPGLAFAGKWQLATAGILQQQWWVVAVLLLGGLLTLAYTFRVLGVLVLATDDDEEPPRAVTTYAAPARARWAALALVLLAIGLGLRPLELVELGMVGVPAGVLR